MKNSILSIVLIIAISSFAHSEEIAVLFNSHNYPFEFINSEGNPDGFNVDLIYAVAREASLSIKFQSDSWKYQEKHLYEGTIEIAPSYFNKKKSNLLINSDSLYTANFTMIYNRKFPIKEYKNLGDKILVLAANTSSAQVILNKKFSDQFIKTKKWSDSLDALSTGYGDYTILPSAQYYLISQNYRKSLNDIESFKLSLPYGFIAAKWNKSTISNINNGISIIKASGEFDIIYKKWFGKKENLIIKNGKSINIISIYFTIAIIMALIIVFTNTKRKA